MQLIIKLAKKDDAFNSFLEKSQYKGETYGWGSANWWYALPELNINPAIDNLWYVFKSKLGKSLQRSSN